MVIELDETEVSARKILVGDDNQQLVAGKHLAVGSYAPNDVWLDETVPEGKVWSVLVYVHIEETDA